MSERVYPRTDSPPPSGEQPNTKPIVDSPPVSGQHHPKPIVDSPPVSGQHHRPSMSQDSFTSSNYSGYGYGYGYGAPQPGTYVVQVPKDQVYRVPPPENAHKYKLYTQKKTHRNSCRRCICCTLAATLILAVVLAVAIAVFFLIYNPKTPSYSVESVHIKGVNLSATRTADVTISPVFNVTVRSENRNGKIGIYYLQGSSIKVYHNGVNFCDGTLTAFYQPPKNVTVLSTELNGAGIVLSKTARDLLMREQRSGKVPLAMDVEVPVKMKVGAVKTWTVTVKVTCNMMVDALTEKAKVVEKDCRVHVKPW